MYSLSFSDYKIEILRLRICDWRKTANTYSLRVYRAVGARKLRFSARKFSGLLPGRIAWPQLDTKTIPKEEYVSNGKEQNMKSVALLLDTKSKRDENL